ncbi:hypothetical protein FNV43_RR07299 [Rhamnella rubrinervis]|uniref:Uncharacterized protein n=1 Tax=Rhamnella rubrinervis TaxID=2594499 RepID=A0A8K0MM25_9ROSA|nr:hypothetical protein FNV43_RR07299 [Rhamnella rubrinervis]
MIVGVSRGNSINTAIKRDGLVLKVRGDKSSLEPRHSQLVTPNDNVPRRNRTAAPAASHLAILENIVILRSVDQVLKCLPPGVIQRLQDPPVPPKAGAPYTFQVAHNGQAGSNHQDGKVP